MAEAIDSSLFFSVPTGWGNSTKSGVSGVDTYARGDSQEDTSSVGILRNSKLCFCTHKTEIASCTFVHTKA